MVALNRFFSRLSWDVVGFSASALCAVHCFALPFILLFTSFAGSSIVHNHFIENIILLFSATIGSISIIPSYLKHHRRALPLAFFAGGLLLITASRFTHVITLETLFTTLGALSVSTSHWLNWRLCRPFHEGTASK